MPKRTIIMIGALVVLSVITAGIYVARYSNEKVTEVKRSSKDNSFAKNIEPKSINIAIKQPIQQPTIPSGQPEKTEGQTGKIYVDPNLSQKSISNDMKGNQTVKNNDVKRVALDSNRQGQVQKQEDMSQSNKSIYIPSRDILTGNVDLQKYKDQIDVLEAKVKAKELELKIAKLASDVSIVPVQTEVTKVQLATTIADKNVKVTEVPVSKKEEIIVDPPSLISVINNTAVIQTASGMQIRVKLGDVVEGGYRITGIGGNAVSFANKDGGRVEIVMKYPASYPVYSSIFASANKTTVQTTTNQSQPQSQQQIPAQYVTVPSLR